jgi:hypothetical protein
MYSDVVLGVEHHISRTFSTDFKDQKGYSLDTDLTADDWVEADRPLQGAVARARPASRSRRIRTSSSGARSARCSAPG